MITKTKIRSQEDMFVFLTKNVRTHEIVSEGNKILGKSLVKGSTRSSFRSFKITYLKNGDEVSITTYGGRTLRYKDERDLFCLMGAFTQLDVRNH